MATVICDTMSGGVISAAITKITTITTLRPAFIQDTFRSPSRFNTTDTIGSSNTIPNMISTIRRKDR